MKDFKLEDDTAIAFDTEADRDTAALMIEAMLWVREIRQRGWKVAFSLEWNPNENSPTWMASVWPNDARHDGFHSQPTGELEDAILAAKKASE